MSIERFGSRYALIAAAVAMAVGTGNIWRFPRVAAEYGSGTFLIVLVLAAVIFAVPLLMTESLLGSKSRLGTVGAFRDFMGQRFSWAGGFMGMVTIGIMFYYSVICGWALYYFAHSMTGTFADPNLDTEAMQSMWDGFTGTPWQTILFHLAAILLVGAIVVRGLKRGFEGLLKIALPVLFVILLVLMVRAVTLPGSGAGLAHLFTVRPEEFANPRVWLEAFTQVAFSTGAGWGLYLTYSVYSRKREDMAGNAAIITVGDLLAGLIAGVTVLCTLFALTTVAQAEEALGAEEGLAFIYFAGLFGEMPGGVVFAPLFFLAVALAGVSSLIAMVELATRNVMDLGATRQRAVVGVVIVTFIVGIPSAVSMDVFSNQDNVWGFGLLASGALACVAMWKYGIGRARAELDAVSPVRMGAWWAACTAILPVLIAGLFGWWMWTLAMDPDIQAWNPLEPFSPASIAMQWGILLIILLVANNWLSRRIQRGPMSGGTEPSETTSESDA
ncbi:sodium-dependent transporter [Lipingzhangella sp. LS1_29]|uniref:Sodium-dependent transporter n=1 Tax=Lipingzhangella rawalii TaxID=2055835 RepID=A0ABU2H778_9ACTN|nr:sodium-dependent transporter [Lipingzhangella rawalii]MDS1271143.1 sodium-dependent transporter [Lipingzhangella rawalii]